MNDKLLDKMEAAIISISKDIKSLEEKFGSATWVLDKKAVLTDMVTYYDASIAYMQKSEHLIKLLTINNKAANIMLVKKELDMPWVKLCGYDPKRLRMAEMLDGIDKDLADIAK